MEKLTQTGAGRLYHKVAFDKRIEEQDEYGNFTSTWEEQFKCRAEFIHRWGSETVLAARLESRSPIEINIRKNSQTLQVGTDWQARDVNRNVAYNIRDIREDNNRAMLRMMLEGGVATG